MGCGTSKYSSTQTAEAQAAAESEVGPGHPGKERHPSERELDRLRTRVAAAAARCRKRPHPCACCGLEDALLECWNLSKGPQASFHCVVCKSKDDGGRLGPASNLAARQTERAGAELECIKAIQDLDAMQASPRALVVRGVQLGWLLEFTRSRVCKDMRTYEVVQQVIIPDTCETRCRYVEMPHVKSGPATVFVSHCWGGLFRDLVAALAYAVQDLDTIVWIDIFAVRQWPGNLADLDFSSVVKQTNAFVLVSAHLDSVAKLTWEEVDSKKARIPEEVYRSCAFFRVWCLVELREALISKKPIIMLAGASNDDMEFIPTKSMLDNMFGLVAVEQAIATVPEDQARIHDTIKTSPGYPAMNARAKGAISGCKEAMYCPKVLAAACGFLDRLDMLSGVEERQTAILAAAAAGFHEPMQKLLLLEDTPEKALDADGSDALMLAAKGDHLDVVKMLLKTAKFDVRRHNQWGYTALMRAANNGHKQVVEVLLAAGADVAAQDKRGETALSKATSFAQSSGEPEYLALVDILANASTRPANGWAS
eukprot:1568246-Pyramimonas_sp.AAC.1